MTFDDDGNNSTTQRVTGAFERKVRKKGIKIRDGYNKRWIFQAGTN